jgi:Glycosyl hydrolases family 16
MTGEPPSVAEEFDGPDLDRDRWLPHYLPHWSSRAETAARYDFRDGALRLYIPREQGLWCPDDHEPPLRVSGIQSGCFSGPVGSPVGQQPFRDGLLVREAQPTFWGWTPGPSRIELRARAVITPRSMVSLWLAGIEDEPGRSGEITVMEVFGRSVEAGRSAEVGMGIKALRDPNAVEDFEAPRLPIDVTEWHTYTVDWTAERAEHLVDGELLRTTRNPPVYPMQLMLAVFDFPEWSTGDDADVVPEFWIDYVREIPA